METKGDMKNEWVNYIGIIIIVLFRFSICFDVGIFNIVIFWV